MTYKHTSNCNLDDNNKDCISAYDPNIAQYESAEYESGIHEMESSTIDENILPDSTSGSTDIQEESSFDSNELQTSSLDNISGDMSVSSTINPNISVTEINKYLNMTLLCENCEIGFALSDDLLSCDGE